ncbi:MAG: ribosome biogenesis GTPase Der [Acidimicrobiia bacterium]|nr:ribosome biogenesis GTPase Der [Acidimicrobiia bacterium]
MSRLPVVAVVGRPNVGKSTLVNRIIGSRAAVVESNPGVTRDRKNYAAEWNGKSFMVVDTGGWEVEGGELSEGIRTQAEVAVTAADLVVFVADATTVVTEDDIAVARLIQRSEVPHILVANKVDGPTQEMDLDRLWGLGLGTPHPVSALHGRNTGDILDLVASALPSVDPAALSEEQPPTIAIIGKPNVGKSTLLNHLVGSQRVLVSPVPGTTRDPVDEIAVIDDTTYTLIDTAGIRRAAKVDEPEEFYSVLRAKKALDRADVALFVVDGTSGVTHQDQRLADEVAASGCAVIVLLNKWDVVDTEQKAVTEDGVADRFAFLAWAPVLRISALTGSRTHRLGEAIALVLENREQRIPTPDLNRNIRRWQEAHPAPVRKGKRSRVIYAVQAGVAPPTIVMFIRGGELGPDYVRFLEGRLRRQYEMTGTPLRLVTRSRRRTHV